MNQKNVLLMLAFLVFTLTACQEKTTTKKSSSSNTNAVSCTGQSYWTTPGCTGYCQYNPNGYGCGGSVGGTVGGTVGTTTSGSTTSGTTTSGTVTGGTTGTVANCSLYPFSFACYCQTNPMATGCPSGVTAVNPYWGMMYPPTDIPPDNTSSSCTTSSPSGVSVYDTRKATVTVIGGAWYNPASGASTLYNTSSTLKSVASAKQFFITDSVLKVRFKPKPQPHSAQTTDTCYGRTPNQSYIAGYYKLKFNVTLVGTRANNTTGEEPLGIITSDINTCTSAIDLSPYVDVYPNGIYLRITDVQSNQGTWPSDYLTNGFKNGSAWKAVRTSDCWTMDIEVSADGTKTFE
jgi:hypothetical protein